MSRFKNLMDVAIQLIEIDKLMDTVDELVAENNEADTWEYIFDARDKIKKVIEDLRKVDVV